MAETEDAHVAEDVDSICGADHEAALTAAHAEGFAAAREQAFAEGFADGYKLGYAEELARLRAIFALPEAKDRRAVALVLATETQVTPEVAARILSTFPTTRATEQRGAAPLH